MKKILVCDEIDSLKKIFFELLHQDYNVEACTDPKEIKLRVKRFQPHLLIVNHNLPHFDGTEICQATKKDFQIPIILVLDKHSSTTIKIDNCSADEILTLPIDTEQLKLAAKRLIAFGQNTKGQ